jgi:hypothetical protein
VRCRVVNKPKDEHSPSRGHKSKHICDMEIDSGIIADLRDMAAGNDLSAIDSISPNSFSIAAVVELALIHNHCSILRSVIEKWASRCLVLNQAIVTLENGALPSSKEMWNVRWLEFFPIRGLNWSASQNYHPFESRFVKAAKQAGFGRTADALAKAMFEMADNVIQHSGPTKENASPGIVGYHIIDGVVTFTICDGGHGALVSLRENPCWKALETPKDALMAIIEKHASARRFGGDGEGFKEVFRSLANLNGSVELRSCDGRVRLSSHSLGREAEPGFIGFLPGLQLRVSCSLKPLKKEPTFPIDYLT